VVAEYDRQKGANPGKLPVIVLDGMPMPVESGSGARRSTNYHPAFKIVGWAARGDFTFVPPDRGVAPGNGAASNGAAQPRTAAPATGAQRAAPPQAAAQQDFASDFG